MADVEIEDIAARSGDPAVTDLFEGQIPGGASYKATLQKIVDLAAAANLLDDLGDVTSSSPSDGQVLTWTNATSDWRPTTFAVSGTTRTTQTHSSAGALSVARSAADQATIVTVSANVTAWTDNLTTDQDVLWLVLDGDGGSSNYTVNLSNIRDGDDLESAGGLGGYLSNSLDIYPDSHVEVLIRRVGGNLYGELTVPVIGSPVASVPGAPQSVNATPGDTTIDVTWSPPSNNGGSAITGYRVGYRTPSGSGSYTYTADLGVTLSHELTGLTNGSEYGVIVEAENSAGWGTASTEDTATPAVASGINSRATAGQGNITGSTYTSGSVPLPSGIQSGDLIEILVGGTDADVGAPDGATATGYTQRHTGQRATAYWPRFTKLYKIAAGTESGTNVTVSWTNQCTRWSYMVNVWSGVDNTTPYDTTEVAGPETSSTNPDPASITTVTNNALVIVQMTGLVATEAADATITGYTSVHDDSFDGSAAFCCLSKTVATAGAEDPAAATWASSSGAYLITDALRPA